MIKLFSKIRYNLMETGKTGKPAFAAGRYLKYAIGEIVLVVIGILIALQLNSWKEKNAERKLEKEYIVSLIEDIKKDIQNFDVAIDLNEQRIKYLDSFASVCFTYEKENEHQVFYLYRVSLRHPDFVSQTDRTLAQLKNAGGMRLITKKTTADSIIQYEGYFKKLTNQQTWYEGMLKDLVSAGIHVFNFKDAPKYKGEQRKLSLDDFNKMGKIASLDKKLIVELGNIANMYGSITEYYLILLKEGKQKSIDLIKVLERDYEIKQVIVAREPTPKPHLGGENNIQ